MATRNKTCTRYYSSLQEDYISRTFEGARTLNSGAGKWDKSDVIIKNAGLSIECKTCTSPKQSFNIKKEWIIKHDQEAKSNQLYNTALAISFEPSGKENYFLINEKLMQFLVQKLAEEEF